MGTTSCGGIVVLILYVVKKNFSQDEAVLKEYVENREFPPVRKIWAQAKFKNLILLTIPTCLKNLTSSYGSY